MNQSLAHFVTLLRKDFIDYCNQRLLEVGISQGLLYFVRYVGKHPDCSPKELAQALHMDIGHTTRSLSKLKQEGLIIQTVNPCDRRAHTLRLTTTGESVYGLSHQLFTQWEEEMLAALSEEERIQLMALLQKLIDA